MLLAYIHTYIHVTLQPPYSYLHLKILKVAFIHAGIYTYIHTCIHTCNSAAALFLSSSNISVSCLTASSWFLSCARNCLRVCIYVCMCMYVLKYTKSWLTASSWFLSCARNCMYACMYACMYVNALGRTPAMVCMYVACMYVYVYARTNI
jgi:hypothetical protein